MHPHIGVSRDSTSLPLHYAVIWDTTIRHSSQIKITLSPTTHRIRGQMDWHFPAQIGPHPRPGTAGLDPHGPAPLRHAPGHCRGRIRTPPRSGARLFVDYCISEQAMNLLAHRVGEYVLAPGIYPPIPGIEDARVRPIREFAPEKIQRWAALFRKIFDPKTP